MTSLAVNLNDANFNYLFHEIYRWVYSASPQQLPQNSPPLFFYFKQSHVTTDHYQIIL